MSARRLRSCCNCLDPSSTRSCSNWLPMSSRVIAAMFFWSFEHTMTTRMPSLVTSALLA